MAFLKQCTDDQLKNICKEFKTTPEAIQRDVQSLMDWLEKQSHLPSVKDQKYLHMFFLRCNASLQRTKKILESYFIHKARMPTVFAHRDPTSALFKTSFHMMVRLPLPALAADLSRVVIIYMDSTNDKEVQQPCAEEFLGISLAGLLIISMMSGIHTGITFIIDTKNLSPQMVTLLMSTVRKFILFTDIQIRVKMMYIINSSSFMEPILFLGRQISKKLFHERLIIWKKSEKDLVEIFPKENLPYEYGGTLGHFNELKDSFLKEMESWKDWLSEEGKYVADLSKLPEDKKETADFSVGHYCLRYWCFALNQISITEASMAFLKQCTDDQLKSICKELGTTPETMQQDVQTLMDWLEKQPHLPNVKDEKFLRMIFLRCKGSLQRTKIKLELYFIHKARMPTVFAQRDPTSALFKTCFHMMAHVPLPALAAADLSRIVIVKMYPIHDKEVQQPSFEEYLHNSLASMLLMAMVNGTHTGFTVILDSKDLSPLLMTLLISTTRKLMLFADILARIKRIYVINLSSLMESLLLFARQLSKQLFHDRLIIWKKSEKDLVEIFPKENLPYEYGGTLGHFNELKDSLLKEMESWKDWLDEEGKYMADLSKLPEDKKETADVSDFGVEGSFRKLNLE